MADSPHLGSEGVLRLMVFSDGAAVNEHFEVLAVHVQRTVNTIPFARIEIRDADVARREFPASDAAAFKPGALIRIDAGYGDASATLFQGVVVKHGIRVSGDNAGRLLIECRDRAAAMAVGRNNANYLQSTDADIIAALIGKHGLEADVAATAAVHSVLTQHYCSDWDFMLTRVEAAGLWVLVNDGKVVVQPPLNGAPAVLSVSYGRDLLEFDAEIDARTQLAQAQAVSWDQKTQAVVLGTQAGPVTLNAQGDLDAAQLAQVLKLETYRLQSGAGVTQENLTQWAKSQQLKAALARVRGQMKFQGSAKALPGALIELQGVGTHFSGEVLLSSVEHHLEQGNWITTARFGVQPGWFAERSDVLAPPAGSLVPGARGLDIGVVLKLDEDPDGEHRVQVSVPVRQAQTEGIWARLATLHGSAGFGTFFVPEVGDEVVLGYFNDDPSSPVVLGALYSSKHAAPYALAAANDIKAVVTRCKSKLEFDEQDRVITLTTPGNNKLVMSDTGKSILIQDQNDNQITLDANGISLQSPKDIKISAQGTIALDAVGAITVTSKSDVKSSGLNVNCEAQVGLLAKGGASAELSAAGQTVVKGALVMIN